MTLFRCFKRFDYSMKKEFFSGLRAGIPIGLGYLSVSFSFGIMAVECGLSWWQALIVSMTNLTSAGQLAGIGIMSAPYQYIEMFVSQLTINIRYSFMSVSLSQKADGKLRGIYRWIFGFFITDEIFASAVSRNCVTRAFMCGIAVFPYIGWASGTVVGALADNILPSSVMSALCIAMYGMFVAVVAPAAVKSLRLVIIVAVAAALSAIFNFVPPFCYISGGLAVSITAVVAAIIGALLFPIKEDASDGQ